MIKNKIAELKMRAKANTLVKAKIGKAPKSKSGRK